MADGWCDHHCMVTLWKEVARSAFLLPLIDRKGNNWPQKRKVEMKAASSNIKREYRNDSFIQVPLLAPIKKKHHPLSLSEKIWVKVWINCIFFSLIFHLIFPEWRKSQCLPQCWRIFYFLSVLQSQHSLLFTVVGIVWSESWTRNVT